VNTLNHAAVGAVIGLAIQPMLAVPLAFASHFLLDALPHFGYPGKGGYGEAFKHKLTYFFIAFDAAGCAILLYLMAGQPLIVWTCALVAVTPDIFWLYRYFWYERKGLKAPGDGVTLWHRRIQWFERPIGFVIEVVFALGILTFFKGITS
jgi:hypothetical protein